MNTKMVLIGLSLSLQTACVPAFLDKYRKEEVRTAPGGKAGSTLSAAAEPAAPKARAAAITQVGDGVFRIQMNYDRVWDTTVDVLLRNYNLQIVERTSGILTTEWDSYYLDGKVHRNKVSVRLKRIGNQGVDLTIHNSVEVLSRLPDGGVSEVWLPSDRNKPEIGRIIQNFAIASGQPKPQLAADFVPNAETPKPSM